MACCSSSEGDEQTKLVEVALAKEWKTEKKVHKLLLLGASQGGKSTLFKQMFVIYGKGFSVEDRKRYIPIVWLNMVGAIEELIIRSIDLSKSSIKYQKCEVKDEKTLASCRYLTEMKYKRGDGMTEEIAHHMKMVWADPGVLHTFEYRGKFHFDDSAEYFLNQIDRVCRPDYLPTELDVIRARHKTTAIVEQDFAVEGVQFKMLDVGGQRSERRKWIHCFSGVTAILFVAALSEYDQTLYEDEKVNRLIESLNLFEKICESKHFKDTTVILFLNKRDLFEEKLKKKSLSTLFPEFKDGNDYEKSVEFLTQKFWSKNKVIKRDIYTHVTCAVDKKNVSVVMASVRATVIRQSLSSSGFAEV